MRFRPRHLAVWAWPTVLALVIFGPLLTGGYPLFLDYGGHLPGPRPRLDPSSWGFPTGPPTSAPINALLVGLYSISEWGPLRLIPFIAVPYLATWGFGRWFEWSWLRTTVAVTFYVLNPFVYERMLAGQIYFLLGYAVFPLLAHSLLCRDRGGPAMALRVGVLFAIVMSLSSHFLFIGGILLLTALASEAVRRRWRQAATIAGAFLVAALPSLYWILPGFSLVGQLDRLTNTDLSLYRTIGDPVLGLFPNVLALYGFWRIDWPLPKDSFSGWFVLFVAMFLVIVAGAVAFRREDKRGAIGVLVALSILGLLLSVGDQGPTGGIYRLLYEQVPGFVVMREPQKFLMLLILPFALFFAVGASWIVQAFSSKALRAGLLALLLSLPAIYSFTLLFGFNGYARASTYPSSWYEADELMGSGDEKALFLPWHLYLAYPWTQHRVVGQPAGSFFEREVIFGDNVEIGPIETQSVNPRSRFLEFVFARGEETKDFGNLIAPLNVRYVLLAKVEDWRAYSWVLEQTDLRVVEEWDDLVLLENQRATAQAHSPDSVVELEHWGEVLGLARTMELTSVAIRVAEGREGPISTPTPSEVGDRPVPVPARRVSPVVYEVADASGLLTFSEPFDAEWRFGGEGAEANMGATNLFRTETGDSGRISFARWDLMRVGYLFSGISLVLLVASSWWLARRSREPRRDEKGSVGLG